VIKGYLKKLKFDRKKGLVDDTGRSVLGDHTFNSHMIQRGEAIEDGRERERGKSAGDYQY
jgi:hypothetical protein